MTVLECIQYVDSIEPNAYTTDQKCRWVREIEGKVYGQLFLQQPNGFPIRSELGLMQIILYELAIPAPYNKIYPLYLQAMIHYANGEYDRYAASMQMFNAAWHELVILFAGDYDISDRARNRRITVRINPEYEAQKLLTIPPRCAFVAGRIVVKQGLYIYEESTLITGNVWVGNPGSYVSQLLINMSNSNKSSGIKMLLGDVEGTDMGMVLSDAADAGEAYLTGILCIPEEELYRWPQWQPKEPVKVVVPVDDSEE